jgi:hypothetical protein
MGKYYSTSQNSLEDNLTLGYSALMQSDRAVSEAAREMARRSVEARKQAWGEKEFIRRMQEWGKKGGRPRVAERKQPEETK